MQFAVIGGAGRHQQVVEKHIDATIGARADALHRATIATGSRAVLAIMTCNHHHHERLSAQSPYPSPNQSASLIARSFTRGLMALVARDLMICMTDSRSLGESARILLSISRSSRL